MTFACLLTASEKSQCPVRSFVPLAVPSPPITPPYKPWMKPAVRFAMLVAFPFVVLLLPLPPARMPLSWECRFDSLWNVRAWPSWGPLPGCGARGVAARIGDAAAGCCILSRRCHAARQLHFQFPESLSGRLLRLITPKPLTRGFGVATEA